MSEIPGKAAEENPTRWRDIRALVILVFALTVTTQVWIWLAYGWIQPEFQVGFFSYPWTQMNGSWKDYEGLAGAMVGAVLVQSGVLALGVILRARRAPMLLCVALGLGVSPAMVLTVIGNIVVALYYWGAWGLVQPLWDWFRVALLFTTVILGFLGLALWHPAQVNGRQLIWAQMWLGLFCASSTVVALAARRWPRLASNQLVILDELFARWSWGYSLGLAAVTALVVVPLEWRYRKAWYRAEGYRKCTKCGYDLTGSFKANVWACPECGQAANERQLMLMNQDKV